MPTEVVGPRHEMIGSFHNGRGEFFDQELLEGRSIFVRFHLVRHQTELVAVGAGLLGGRGSDVGDQLGHGVHPYQLSGQTGQLTTAPREDLVSVQSKSAGSRRSHCSRFCLSPPAPIVRGTVEFLNGEPPTRTELRRTA